MLLGGKGGCQQCSCVPCNACTATCTNPHTGTAFETVYHYYVLGVEEGNVTDGYLTAGGDVDTSDPYDGMDGTGPWYQDITGSFSFSPEQTRYPCVIRLSFWRNSFPLGPTTIPPPSSSLTGNTIKVNCLTGAVRVGDQIVNAGELYDTGFQVPSVSGAGDQSANDPRGFLGTISIAPVCDTATFTVTARIDWNTKKRQHILYGTVRECYEVGTPCATVCSGNPAPSVLYLTISNYTGPALASGSPNGTYVLDRVSNYCNWYLGGWAWGCIPSPLDAGLSSGSDGVSAYMGSNAVITASSWQTIGGECRLLVLWVNTPYNSTALTSFCGTGVLASGTNGVVLLATAFPATTGDIVTGSFDWKIET